MIQVASQKSKSMRKPLSRERVLETAVALADQRGAEALTMRKLAAELGVEAMSLYNHVENKNDLLDGMINLVFGEIEVPAPSGDWKSELRTRATSTRNALNRHLWALGAMEGRTDIGPEKMRVHEGVLACLRGAGFTVEMTIHAYSVQDAYIYGFVLQEADMSSETPEDFAKEAKRQMKEYESIHSDFPNLVEVVGGYVAEHGYDYDTEFMFGLDVILDGLERLLPAGAGAR